MKQEIRKRIKQINQGIVPENYKQTKVGIIPEDWEVKQLGDVLGFKNGINAKKEQYGKGFKFINVLDILNNNYITYEKIIDRVDIDENSFEKNKVEYGDVLFQRSSETVEEAGTANVYLSQKPVTFGGFVIRGKKKGEYLPIYFNYMLKNSSYRKQVQQKAAGSTRYNIGQDSICEIYFSAPSLREQQRIASVLSTWDRAIELKESLIKEKEEQKKELMEVLLKTKANWKIKNLGELVTRKKGKAVNIDENGKYPVLGIQYLNGESEPNFTNDSSVLAEKDDILLLWDGANAGSIFTHYEGAVGSTFMRLRPSKVNSIFIREYMRKDENYIKSIREGSGIPHVPRDFLSYYKINLPPLPEQKRIAKILSTADREIELLKQEVEQLKEQKKGLMQLLLTGIIRVKEDSDE